MKLCSNHEAALRTELWRRGVPPRPGDHRPPGEGIGEPYAAALTLFYANMAKNFLATIMNSPAEMCPCGENKDLEEFLKLSAESIELQTKRESL